MDLTDLNALKIQESNNNAIHVPPPVPSRNNHQNILNNQNSTLGYGSGYSQQLFGANHNLYSSANSYGYSNFSNYSSPFSSSNYGLGTNNSSSTFLRTAEESSRSAFQSMESVVYAFSAVSAMFESTYCTVYNLFRAVVGVADQFYRLKTHLSGVLSAFALIRYFKYILRKLLRLIKLNAKNSNLKDAIEKNEAWNIANDAEKFVKDNRKRQTNWPLILFFGVVFGGPWLIWKIISSIESINKDDSLWMTGKIDHFIAVSEYNFDAVNSDELSFRRGQRIIVAPKEYQPKIRGWLLGSIDGKTQGILPANYLKILGKKMGENSKNKQTENYVPSGEEKNLEQSKMEQIYDEVS